METSVPPATSSPEPETPPSGAYRAYRRRLPASERMMFVVGIILGILVFVGFLAFHGLFLVPYPCPSTVCSPPSPDVAAYQGVVQALAWIAVASLDAAVGMSVGLAFILGSRSDLPESTRRSVFLFATVFVAAWSVFTIFFFLLFGTFFRYL